MSKLYPDMKPPKEKVKCMDCDEFDMKDMFCIPGQKVILDPYEEKRCAKFVPIKEKPTNLNIDTIKYYDADGKHLWDEPMTYSRLWAVGDWFIKDEVEYGVLAVGVKDRTQTVNIGPRRGDV